MKKLLFFTCLLILINGTHAKSGHKSDTNESDSPQQTKCLKRTKVIININNGNLCLSLPRDVIRYILLTHLDVRSIINLKHSCKRFNIVIDASVFDAKVSEKVRNFFPIDLSSYYMFLANKIYLKAKRDNNTKEMKRAAKMGHSLAIEYMRKKRSEKITSFIEFVKSAIVSMGAVSMPLPTPISQISTLP